MAPNVAQVYVIDDDATAREEVIVIVRPLGVDIHSFASAESFLAAYDGYRPSCIIADMRMVAINDTDLLLELRSRGLTIPVIVLTAHADTPSTVQVMKNGAFTTLDRPCQRKDLWDAIEAALHEDLRRSEEDRRRQEIRQRLDQITPQELDVLKRLLAGDNTKEIAYRLDIGERTVERRRNSLTRKMQTDSIAELVKLVLLAEPELVPPKPLE